MLVSIVYICQSQSPSSSHPPNPLPFPPWYPYIFSLCLCLYFCFANKIIYTIFLDPIYICALIYDICFCFWLTSFCMTVSRSIHVSTNSVDRRRQKGTEVIWKDILKIYKMLSSSSLKKKKKEIWEPVVTSCFSEGTFTGSLKFRIQTKSFLLTWHRIQARESGPWEWVTGMTLRFASWLSVAWGST